MDGDRGGHGGSRVDPDQRATVKMSRFLFRGIGDRDHWTGVGG